ncbi:MAG: PepSY domain-containing protein [Eubacteriales bacterium]|nr:PepSY domain-containing protein [Eubacteriales bacterium]
MKKTIFFALSATTLTALLLAGCGASKTENDVYPQIGSAAGTQTEAPAAAGTDYIGEDEAKKVALENAQQDEADVTNLRVTLDEDHDGDDPTVYDVEFLAGDNEYDYEIDAITGDILSQDIDAVKTGTTTASAQTSSDYIGEKKAKKIALKDAGLTSSDVSALRVVLDIDDDGDDPTVYDVEFYAGNTEYDYEIDAVSGDILSKDADAEHIDASAANNSDADRISESKAKKTALKHAGLKESEVEYLTVKLDRDNGIYEYEVEFYVGRLEYSYEINAVSGEIISYETDYDD